jgi:hypothetical protein
MLALGPLCTSLVADPGRRDKHMKMSVKVLTAVLFFAGFATCASADLTWDVNAVFSYNSTGNTATGTFTVNTGLTGLTTWDIFVAGSNTQANNEYTPGNSFPVFDTTHVDLYDFATNQNINLYLSAPLSNSGGTIPLLFGDGGLTNNSTIVCAGCGTLVEGVVTTTPEPLSLVLFGTGLLAIMGVVRRKLPDRSSLAS